MNVLNREFHLSGSLLVHNSQLFGANFTQSIARLSFDSTRFSLGGVLNSNVAERNRLLLMVRLLSIRHLFTFRI